MANDVDKSLLDRLQALRGSSISPDQAAPAKAEVDLIERAKTPSREDTLAARLKSLRNQDDASPSAIKKSPAAQQSPVTLPPRDLSSTPTKPKPQHGKLEGGGAEEDVDAMFQTDDNTLEELLGQDDPGDGDPYKPPEPSDEEVKALLEQLADAIPKDDAATVKHGESHDEKHDSDDSDGEQMNKEVDDVIARFKDEAELDTHLQDNGHPDHPSGKGQLPEPPDADFTLPSVPTSLADLPSSPSQRTTSTSLTDLTARMASLRSSSPSSSSTFALPSVPTSRPTAGKPVQRLTSRTNYTDDDMDGWCTVCLEDATLRCLGCDDDVYCTRCWREMHVGPAAGFDERSHKAVHFTRDGGTEKRKVALGA
ncbi:hypothetical protein S40285_08877 [Stachybotrys chlorohalonatus IBT 40285]|uniref:Uncharacterized protein n=1 Tax=Stachybotrys chlorohalonatus (strain IBT 40285) TaxID=1283841 RepID=A0A084QKN1_STAC4|nr:hypothetical protein S40285_08877 [Stachybotrys chlorohalonata IBT 40285]